MAFETHGSLVGLISEHHVYPDSLYGYATCGQYQEQTCFHLSIGDHMLAALQANAHLANQGPSTYLFNHV